MKRTLGKRMSGILLLLAMGFLPIPPLMASAQDEARKHAARQSQLNRTQQEIIETQLMPALRMGDGQPIVMAVRPLIGKAEAARVQALDRSLSQAGCPPVCEILAAAYIQLAEQGRTVPNQPSFGTGELRLTLIGVRQQLEEAIAKYRSSELLSAKKLAQHDFEAFEKLLWGFKAAAGQIASDRRAVAYAVGLATQNKRVNQTTWTDADRQQFIAAFQGLRQEVDQLSNQLREREILARMARLTFVSKQLAAAAPGPATGNLQLRFQAAFAIESDRPVLQEYFQARSRMSARAGPDTAPPSLAELCDPGLSDRVAELIRVADASMDDAFRRKARLCYEGLQWWLRGRYGMGSEAGGLLKPMTAMRNSDAMLALYMPETPIKATDPAGPRGVGAQAAGQAQMPTFPRRHYFLWRLTMQEKRVDIQERDGGIPRQPSPKKVFC